MEAVIDVESPAVYSVRKPHTTTVCFGVAVMEAVIDVESLAASTPLMATKTAKCMVVAYRAPKKAAPHLSQQQPTKNSGAKVAQQITGNAICLLVLSARLNAALRTGSLPSESDF